MTLNHVAFHAMRGERADSDIGAIFFLSFPVQKSQADTYFSKEWSMGAVSNFSDARSQQ